MGGVRRGRVCILYATLSLVVTAFVAQGATWAHIGTSGFAMGDGLMVDGFETRAENHLTDANRVKLSSMVVDFAGNVFAVCNDGENNAASLAGGVSIFRSNGSVVNLNLQAAGLFGGVTKLVLAGDGMVYGVQNYAEIQWPGGYRGYPHRILRLQLDGTTSVIWQAPESLEGSPPVNKSLIRGIATGPGGHVYWIMNGASEYWRYNFLWRYNVVKDQVEPAPINSPLNDDGWSETYGISPFEYVGGDWFAIMRSDGRRVSAVSWTLERRGVVNEGGASWASDRTTSLVYDPAYRRLWHGPRGTSDPGSKYTAIMSRWSGSTSNPGLFSATADDPKTGIIDDPNFTENAGVWHMNGNDPGATGESNGGKYWCNALAVNPVDGTGWMSWGGDKCMSCSAPGPYNYVGYGPYGALGGVYTVPRDAYGPSGDEGSPRTSSPRPSWVMALTFGERDGSCWVFALTCDLNTGQYDLYQAPTACPLKGACCQRENACSMETRAACQVLGGEYHGDNVSCAQTSCNLIGACCHRRDVCTQELATDCTAPDEAYQGLGVACSAVDCRWEVCQDPAADADADGDVDAVDFGVWQACLTIGGGDISSSPIRCDCYDLDANGSVDVSDLAKFTACGSGPGIPADPGCDASTR